MSLPVPVTFSRLRAARFVLIFGISTPQCAFGERIMLRGYRVALQALR